MKRLFWHTEKLFGNGDVNFQWQTSKANYLVTCGSNGHVNVFNRHGEPNYDFATKVSGHCTGLAWDPDGDVLAISSDQNSHVILWDTTMNRTIDLDVGLREPITAIQWSASAKLAVGSAKGNLQVYNHRADKRLPAPVAKHTKKIVSLCWSRDEKLALASEDKNISVSDANGDHICQLGVRADPSMVEFSDMKMDEKLHVDGQDNTISAVIGGKTLLLLNLHDVDNPIELAFQSKYGTIVTYKWYGDGYLMLGFSLGYFIMISTHMKEIGQELFQTKAHKSTLSAVDLNWRMNKVAVAGDSCVKVHDMSDLRETEQIITVEEESSTSLALSGASTRASLAKQSAGPTEVDKVAYTNDGQLVAVSTKAGSLHVFLAKLPSLGEAFGTRIAILSSLLEVTISNSVLQEPDISISLELEPAFLALGPFHLAVGMNNCVWFYELLDRGENTAPVRSNRRSKSGQTKVTQREYMGTVSEVKLSEKFAAVRCQNSVQLHRVGMSSLEDDESSSKLFPENAQTEGVITAIALTPHFFIYATNKGSINYFSLEDWCPITHFQHAKPVTRIFPEITGTRLLAVDDIHQAFVYCPIDDSLVAVEELPNKVEGVLWENYEPDKHIFATYDDKNLHTFVYVRDSIYDSSCKKVGGATPLYHGHRPVMLHNGQVFCQSPGGKMITITLSTHTNNNNPSSGGNTNRDASQEGVNADDVYLDNMLKMNKIQDALSILGCQKLNSSSDSMSHQGVTRLKGFAEAALAHLRLDYAIRFYQMMGDVGMVMNCKDLLAIEDKRLLCGHIAAFVGEFDRAQEHFLASTNPKAALDMRRDLLHWETAMTLAQNLSPEDLPFISREYANQLEFQGDYLNALQHFEQGLNVDDTNTQGSLIGQAESEHQIGCAAGVARTAIRLGDIRRGIGIAHTHPSRVLKKECAAILEQMKQYIESAQLYEKAGFYEKAATVYIKCKNWGKVGELLPHITSPKLHLQYAKAREAEGKFREAIQAYSSAKDFDNVIRILVDHLQNPEEAVRIVRETGSIEGAKLVAKFFVRLNDMESAIQFLVMSKCHDEAFQLASTHHHMKTYASILGDDVSEEDYKSVAVYFETEEKDPFLAGKFFYKSKQYPRAVKHLLRCPITPATENDPNINPIEIAIKAVGEADDEVLTHQLMDFLMGEFDNEPKDAKYLFRLYMALGQYREAAKTATIIAREEQNSGNYRIAHDVLFGMFADLKDNSIKIPQEMATNLMLLHSYLLVRVHVKKGDHLKAANLLVRVANNISKFPSHVIQILTSTVVECHRSGMRGSAFDYASMLMRQEYRQNIDPKYKSKIENIVRKQDKSEIDAGTSACPYCNFELPDYQLSCSECKNNVPYCIATGRHLVKDNWTVCPVEKCGFPAIFTEFQAFLESEGGCPMCGTAMPAHSVSRLEGDQVKQALAIAAGLQSTQDSGATNNENSSNE
ncbi:WD repeat-containing protein 19-like isoform X2 [Symsagittifera roscoffensis]|uniref:WD repeat-containing protein 19-like isoform X2 n=1 Tax=Symsagittifera roscoffensis TaxID=84072 RepID=UPI00307B5AAE